MPRASRRKRSPRKVQRAAVRHGSELVRMGEPVLGKRESEYVKQALATGWISAQGDFVERFEDGFSRYCGARYGVAVTSGTTALHLAMAVLGIGPGDEVILPALTHIAVPNAVRLCGGKPVLVDSERDTWNLDPNALQARVSARTRAVVVTHLYGHSAELDGLLQVTAKHGIPLIEDAAEAHGATCKGRRVGSFGALACFSFYANKIITTGEGGMLVTRDPALAARARKLRDQAYQPGRKFVHAEQGFNYRFNNLQAAVGLGQLERIEEFVALRRRNARLYTRLLKPIVGLSLPPEKDWATNVYWMYSVLVQDAFGMDAEGLMAALGRRRIETRPFFYPVHLQPLYREAFAGERYPVAEELARRGVNLPSGNELTEAAVRRVAAAIGELQAAGS